MMLQYIGWVDDLQFYIIFNPFAIRTANTKRVLTVLGAIGLTVFQSYQESEGKNTISSYRNSEKAEFNETLYEWKDYASSGSSIWDS